MKTNIAKLVLFVSFLFWTLGLMAQVPPHPPAPNLPNSHGSNQNQNAPIGNGLILLIGLSAVYGAKKVYSTRQEEQE